jgi:hypothetical protein
LIDELVELTRLCRCRYLVNTPWFKKLKRFLSGGRWSQAFGLSVKPGPIDNWQLYILDNSPRLTDLYNSRSQGKDFVLVPEEAWNILRDEFGLHPGQEPLARKVRH